MYARAPLKAAANRGNPAPLVQVRQPSMNTRITVITSHHSACVSSHFISVTPQQDYNPYPKPALDEPAKRAIPTLHYLIAAQSAHSHSCRYNNPPGRIPTPSHRAPYPTTLRDHFPQNFPSFRFATRYYYRTGIVHSSLAETKPSEDQTHRSVCLGIKLLVLYI